jgi:hypothetical protein
MAMLRRLILALFLGLVGVGVRSLVKALHVPDGLPIIPPALPLGLPDLDVGDPEVVLRDGTAVLSLTEENRAPQEGLRMLAVRLIAVDCPGREPGGSPACHKIASEDVVVRTPVPPSSRVRVTGSTPFPPPVAVFGQLRWRIELVDARGTAR